MAEIGGVPKSGLEAITKANLYLISDGPNHKRLQKGGTSYLALIRLHWGFPRGLRL